MSLNKAKGNMYPFVTHTWNPIRGECPHGCSYCYMKKVYKRFGKIPAPVHIDERELFTDLGKNNFIFVGSSCDMFAKNVPDNWIQDVTTNAHSFDVNRYLFKTKNPARFTSSYLGLSPKYGNNGLLEPPKEKLLELITELKKFTKVYLKTNLRRLVK